MKNTVYESPATKVVTVQFRTQLLQTSQIEGGSTIDPWGEDGTDVGDN